MLAEVFFLDPLQGIQENVSVSPQDLEPYKSQTIGSVDAEVSCGLLMLIWEWGSGFYRHLQGGGVIHGIHKRLMFPCSGFGFRLQGIQAAKHEYGKELHPDPKP